MLNEQFLCFFLRYGNPEMIEEKNKQFSTEVMSHISGQFLDTFVKIVRATKTNYISSKCLNLAVKYINHSTRVRHLAQLLQPHMEDLLQNYMVPLTFFTKEDEELWQDNPNEFIRRQHEFFDGHYLPKNAAIDTIVSLCSYRSNPKSEKPDLLESFLGFCNFHLQQYSELVAANP